MKRCCQCNDPTESSLFSINSKFEIRFYVCSSKICREIASVRLDDAVSQCNSKYIKDQGIVRKMNFA